MRSSALGDQLLSNEVSVQTLVTYDEVTRPYRIVPLHPNESRGRMVKLSQSAWMLTIPNKSCQLFGRFKVGDKVSHIQFGVDGDRDGNVRPVALSTE